MPIRTGQITCNGTAQQIDGTSANPFKLVVHNSSSSDAIYLGNSDVTTSTGFDLHAKSTLVLEMPPLTTLFVIGPAGSPTLTWMSIS